MGRKRVTEEQTDANPGDGWDDDGPAPETDESSNGLALPAATVRGGQVIAGLLGREPSQQPVYATDVDTSTLAGRAIVFNALSDGTIDMPKEGVLELDVAHWLVHEAEPTDPDTGEVTKCLRVVFIRPDGGHFATFSPIIADRLSRLLSLCEDGRLPGIVRLRVEERTARRSGRTYHNLTIVCAEG